jgi:hypothetical protein
VSGNVESLVFDLLVRDRASEGIGKIGRTAEGAAKDTDTLTQRLNELSRKSVEARVKLAGDKEAQAALDKMDSRLITLDKRVASPNLRIEGVARAIAEISAVDLELDKLGGKGGTAEAATSALGAGGLSGPGGMGALIGAGVILSPVIATLGIGLGGLGLAAFGVSKNAKLMKTELAPLKDEFRSFSESLQPEVLDAFGSGVRLAGHLLHDIQPIAAATGKALDGVLGQIDAEFQSGTWQDFFGFMARTAGPDMQLLGNVFVQLADDIPPILTQLQPLAEGFLKDTDAILKLVNAGTTAVAWEHQHAAAVSNNTGLLGRFGHAAEKAFEQMFPGVKAAGQLKGALDKMGTSSDKAGQSTGRAGDAFKGAWPKAQSYAQWVQASAKATTNLATAQNAAVSAQLAYGNDILTSANDAETFRQKLKASAGQVGLHTQAQRDSFGAANTYIGDLARQATTAVKSGHGTDAAITAIRNGLPALDSAKTKNRQYWQEVKTLDAYLHQLELIKFISTPIHVTGTGKWSVTGTTITPGVAHGPQNIGAAPGGFAGGGRVPFSAGIPGRDSVLVMTKPGEIFVPPEKGPMLAPALHAAGIPGFASGGVAGSYGPGHVSGLPSWTGGRIDATLTAIAQNTAQAALNAMRAAQSAAKSTGFGANVPNVGSGVGRWAGLVRQALAMEHLNPFYILEVLYQMQTESGGNPNAINLTDSNAAAGDPSRGLMQTIMSTFLRWHWPGTSFNIYDPLANVAAALNYGAHNGRGFGTGAGQIGSGHGYGYGTSSAAPGWAWVGERGPELMRFRGGEQVAPVHAGSGRGGGGNTYITVHVHAPVGSSPRDIGRQLADYLGAHVKGGGRIYPAGVTPR